jgi:hypothetical protein
MKITEGLFRKYSIYYDMFLFCRQVGINLYFTSVRPCFLWSIKDPHILIVWTWITSISIVDCHISIFNLKALLIVLYMWVLYRDKLLHSFCWLSRLLSCDTNSRLLSCDTITRFIWCDAISRLLSCDTVSRLLSCDTISRLQSASRHMTNLGFNKVVSTSDNVHVYNNHIMTCFCSVGR